MQKILLKGGKFFNGETFIDGDLLVENGKISKIEGVDCSNALEINVEGCIVTPGLIDIHTHLLDMGNQAFGYPADFSTIPFGVTYAVDACALHSNHAVLDNLLVKTKVFIPLQLHNGDINYTAMEERLEFYKDKILGIKVYFDKTLNNGVDEEIFKKACNYAKQKNLKVMVHCSYSPISMEKIVDILNKGDIITHAYHGNYHAIYENDYIAYKKAKQKGVFIDVGMAGCMHTDFSVLKNAIENGYIPDTISTDITKFSAYIRGGVYGLPMCMSICKEFGLSEIDVFKAVTINASNAIGVGEWFSLNNANLAVLKYEDLKIEMNKDQNCVSANKGYKCKLTVVNGQIIYRD